jgi:hypothetical protein
MCGSAFIFSEGWDNLMLQKFTLVQFYAMALRFARKAKFHVQDIMSRLYS